VEVSPVVEKEVLSIVELVGTAEAWLETVLASEEPGLVREMLVDEGDKVRKGQVLCKLEAAQLRLTIMAQEAALAEAEVQVARARREWERQKRLFEINSVSEKAYEDARFDLEGNEKRVVNLKAQLKVLDDRLAKKTITAPVAGHVVNRHALVGQWLDQGDSVVTLVVLDPVRFMVHIPEIYVPRVQKGDRAQVAFDALSGRSFQGRIAAVIPRAEAASRTFPVRIEIRNRSGEIRAGMLGRGKIPVGRPYRAVLVPKDALVLSGRGAGVYRVNEAKAHLVPVETGPARGPLIEVVGDLKAGDAVVIRGNERLRPGQPVQVLSQ
jgi:RND family efflux transporter MFP subunit